ncbi:hypothetical protein [Nocardia sp. NPDC050406]|uniref:hypothetical protein n=1 Tax=Nocardia sp. NPDC050406 TaxID=3364318 RepID=UPI0037A36C83
MSTPEIDPTSAAARQEDADFAGEHSKPTHADEHSQPEDIERDESSPRGEGGDGGLDPSTNQPL